MRREGALAAVGVILVTLAATSSPVLASDSFTSAAVGIHKIKHVIVIMQENRSFDTYFGTFPGANGIPMSNGKPTVCLPVGDTPTPCIKPFHSSLDSTTGGPHGRDAGVADIDGGAMDGFARYANDNQSMTAATDVMGWNDKREIPNYWAYARNFVLQDAMFESVQSYSLPSHLYLVSEWSARCSIQGDPSSCKTNAANPVQLTFQPVVQPRPDYSWTDLTWLLHENNVSWAYYVAPGTQPDCYNDGETCQPLAQDPGTPEIWNPVALLRRCAPGQPGWQCPDPGQHLHRALKQPATGGFVGNAELADQRASPVAHHNRPELCHSSDQRRNEVS